MGGRELEQGRGKREKQRRRGYSEEVLAQQSARSSQSDYNTPRKMSSWLTGLMSRRHH